MGMGERGDRGRGLTSDRRAAGRPYDSRRCLAPTPATGSCKYRNGNLRIRIGARPTEPIQRRVRAGRTICRFLLFLPTTLSTPYLRSCR